MRVCLDCRNSWNGEAWTCPRCGFAPENIGGYPAFAPELAAENSNYPTGYFDVLSAVDQRHFWFRARGAMVTWAIERHFGAPRSVMEIGCGVGGMLARIRGAFPDAALTGSDIHTAALPYTAARLPGAALLQMDATRMPFDAEFDVIAACDVIEHIERDDLALAEMHRAVKPGGGIVVTVPQDPKLWSAWDELSFHQRRYTRPQLLATVQAAGFRVERLVSMSSLVYPLLRLTRGRARRQASCDPDSELKVAAPVNFALSRVMDFERFLLRHGISFPFGGSLLLVARRA
jgi:ubiquinone/menaquinone biosynthesis C-methylase UbiE